MDRVGSMSDEEAEVEFQDSVGGEVFAAEPPEAEGGKPGELEPWVIELIGRVGDGESLSTNDKARLPVALQLQAQHHAVALQSQSEAAAAKVARAQSLQSAEILKQLHAVQESSAKEIAAVKEIVRWWSCLESW